MKSLHTSRHYRWLIWFLPLVAQAASCSNMGAAARLGPLIAEHELADRLLPVRTDFGGKVWDEARKFSSTVTQYAEEHGAPAYVMPDMPTVLIMFTLLYPERDTAVYFRGPNALSPTAAFDEVIEETPIPRFLWGRMSDQDQALAENARQGTGERPLYGLWREAPVVEHGPPPTPESARARRSRKKYGR